MRDSAERVRSYLSRHWFKFGMVLILVFILLKKDLSFQINLRSPVRMEKPTAQPPQPVKEQEETRERLTDNLDTPPAPSSPETPPPVDRFEFPSIGGETPKRPAAARELAQIDEAAQQAFLDRFTHVAEAEHRKYGIPASIVLANGMLLSQAGKRDLAVRGNNFFALPCTADWQGASGTYQGRCYRHYENAWTSFRDHSLYLTTGARSHLRQLPPDDYRAWAKALEKAGFGEESKLADQLIRIIETHALHTLDSR